jgi:formamidopyrimidine-DNA glycosylase
MPELPEVEVAARNLRRWTAGRRIVSVRPAAAARRIFRVDSERAASARALAVLVGARFGEIRRIGKNLLVTLDGRSGPIGVWSHLGMTGKWSRRSSGEAAPRFSRLAIELDDRSQLHYVDLRLFGRFRVVPAARFDEVAELRALGPDPLADGIDAAALHARLARSKLPIKIAMLDQRLFAGVGNIQANEALFRAGIDPRRPARALSRREVAALGAAVLASIRFTLDSFAKTGADGGAADIGYVEEGADNPFLVYDRAGAPCPKARRSKAHPTILRIVQGGRSTFYCPRCQL